MLVAAGGSREDKVTRQALVRFKGTGREDKTTVVSRQKRRRQTRTGRRAGKSEQVQDGKQKQVVNGRFDVERSKVDFTRTVSLGESQH